MTYELSGRVALVTGAARGIGLATALALRGRGASVVLVDLDLSAVEAAAASIGDPGHTLALAADVTDRKAMDRVVGAAVERFGGLDVVVANAGIANAPGTGRTLDEAEFERVIEVNLLGVWRTVRAALPYVVDRGGNVTVVSSIYAFTNGMGALPYAMAKAGVEQLGRALRTELSVHGATATVAYFGFIDTEMVHRAFDRHPAGDRLLERLPAPLRKRLPASAAGEGIVRAIERGAPRVILPRRWAALSVLRGIVNPAIDAYTRRDRRIRSLLRELEGTA